MSNDVVVISLRVGALLRSVIGMSTKLYRNCAASSVFKTSQGRRHAETWLMRSGNEQSKWALLTINAAVMTVIMVLILVVISFPILVTTFIFKYLMFSETFVMISTFSVAAVSALISAMWMRFLTGMSYGPFEEEHDFAGLPRFKENVGADPRRTQALKDVLQAMSNGNSKAFMERVRSELGIEDARALMLVLAFPDEADAPIGGEAEELLARVAEVLRDMPSQTPLTCGEINRIPVSTPLTPT